MVLRRMQLAVLFSSSAAGFKNRESSSLRPNRVSSDTVKLPTIDDVRVAATRIASHIHRTQVLRCAAVDERVGARVFFKCENFQKVGAFKARGACNAVLSLTDEQAESGVATHSSGNHAAAVALAARVRGIPAYVVMPTSTSAVKREAVAGYGAQITDCEPTLEARESTLDSVVARTGAVFIPPYDDPRVIAGQGTAALELLTEVPHLDLIVTPVGGGGLLAGSATTAAGLDAKIRVVGAEPKGADDAERSFRAGRLIPSIAPNTIADGLLTSLGELNFAVIRERVADIVTVDEAAIIRAMRFVWQRMKIIIEPSSAVPVAAVLDKQVQGKNVGVILSGGNVDLDRLPWIVDGP